MHASTVTGDDFAYCGKEGSMQRTQRLAPGTFHLFIREEEEWKLTFEMQQTVTGSHVKTGEKKQQQINNQH